jgi:hypothetical protein
MAAGNHSATRAGLSARAFLARAVAMVARTACYWPSLPRRPAPGGDGPRGAGRRPRSIRPWQQPASAHRLRPRDHQRVQITAEADVAGRHRRGGRRILTPEGNALAAYTHQVIGVGVPETLNVPASSTVVTLVDVVLSLLQPLSGGKRSADSGQRTR